MDSALIYIGGFILTVGDIFMKQWSENNNWYSFMYGMLTWIVALLCLAFSFKSKNIAISSLIFTISNVVTLTLLSWLYYKEPLTLVQVFGIGFGIFAIIFLE